MKIQTVIKPKYRLAVGVSGSGTTFEAIYKAIKSRKLLIDLAFVFADRECPAVEKAKKHNIKVVVKKSDEKIEDFHKRIIKKLQDSKVDVVALAGYLRLFPVSNEDSFLVLNSHPAAIPYFGGTGFWGIRVHEAVIDFTHATKFRHPYTYSTIHIATGEYDTGPVIGQKKLEILKTDTPEILAQKLLKIEHENYTEVLKRFSNNIIEYQNYPKDIILEKEIKVLKNIKENILKRYIQ